jgi:peptide chain release factor 2
MAKKQAALDGVEKSEIGWGHQIRSYVLQPYQQVKDTRSNIPYTNVDNILDGDIDKLLEGVLITQAK